MEERLGVSVLRLRYRSCPWSRGSLRDRWSEHGGVDGMVLVVVERTSPKKSTSLQLTGARVCKSLNARLMPDLFM